MPSATSPSRLHSLADNRALLTKGVVWAASNWLLDATCLWVCLAAFNYALNPIDLFVAYGVGNVLAAIPLTPGGSARWRRPFRRCSAASACRSGSAPSPSSAGACSASGFPYLRAPDAGSRSASAVAPAGPSAGPPSARSRRRQEVASASRETEVGTADDETAPPGTVEDAAEPAPPLVRQPRWLARLDRWGWFAERR